MAKNKIKKLKIKEETPLGGLAESKIEDSVEVGFDSKNKAEKIRDLEKQKISKLRNKVEEADLKIDLKKAKTEAESFKFLEDDKKVKKLLQLAREKGVIYAVSVAKKLSDPYILDTLHDKLEENGLYKDFIK